MGTIEYYHQLVHVQPETRRNRRGPIHPPLVTRVSIQLTNVFAVPAQLDNPYENIARVQTTLNGLLMEKLLPGQNITRRKMPSFSKPHQYDIYDQNCFNLCSIAIQKIPDLFDEYNTEDQNSWCLTLKWDTVLDDIQDTMSCTVLPIIIHLESKIEKKEIPELPYDLNVSRCLGLVLELLSQERKSLRRRTCTGDSVTWST
jgi:hypothetical protein